MRSPPISAFSQTPSTSALWPLTVEIAINLHSYTVKFEKVGASMTQRRFFHLMFFTKETQQELEVLRTIGDSLTCAQCLRINAFLLASASDCSVPVCVGVLGKPLTILWLRLNARHESAREVAAGLGSGRNRRQCRESAVRNSALP